MHRRSIASALVLLVLVMGLTACSDDGGAETDSVGDSSTIELSTTPDPDMWTDGTAECPVTGVPAAEAPDTTPADEGVDGVLAFGTLSQEHVEGCVDYPVSPPVGGDHNPVWANCGFYTSAVPNEHAVHSLEHGAAWIAFGPDVDAATLDVIREAMVGTTHVIASPYPDLGTTIVMSAWSRQLTLDDVTDPRFRQFLDTYVQGPQTPELGAPCSGAMGTPASI
jgi:hypothetical protein